MQRPRLLTLLLFCALSWMPATQAAGEEEEVRWYDVEVLLFVQNSESYRESEQWPLDYTLPQLDEARTLTLPSAGTEQPQPFTLLPTDTLRLNEDAARIQRATDIELLLHFGWRQPGLSEEESIPVRIDSDMLATIDAPRLEAPEGNEPPRLEGTLRLILSRYLHIRTDLLYREPLETNTAAETIPSNSSSGSRLFGQTGATEEALPEDLFMLAEEQSHYQVYRMQQSRRMRSEELHYLDHPVFGMAIKVFPYELPKEENNNPTAENTTTPQGG